VIDLRENKLRVCVSTPTAVVLCEFVQMPFTRSEREERHTQSVIKTSVLECFDQSAEMIITNGIKYNRFSKNLVDLGV
jgi:hypothetical protein